MFKGLYILLIVSTFAFGADIPKEGEIDSALATIPTYVSAPETLKAEKKEKLKTALKFARSVAANQEFWNYLNKNWDSSLSPEKKQQLMEEAKEQALDAGKKRVEEILNMRNENGKLLLTRALNEAMPSNTATETYYERDIFIGIDGKLDFRIAEFGNNSSIPLQNRVATDPIAWADGHFIGDPKERMRQIEEMQSKRIYGVRSGTSYSTGVLSLSPAFGSCGAPSSQAAAIRPESHGSR